MTPDEFTTLSLEGLIDPQEKYRDGWADVSVSEFMRKGRLVPTQPPEAEVSREVANHVLAVFGGGEGYAPGNFFWKLLEAAAVADSRNLWRLAAGFPEYAAAIRMWKFESGGADRLRAIAKSL